MNYNLFITAVKEIYMGSGRFDWLAVAEVIHFNTLNHFVLLYVQCLSRAPSTLCCAMPAAPSLPP